MYREIIIIIVVIVLIVGLDMISNNYTKETVYIMSDKLMLLKQEIQNENKENINNGVKEILDTFEERYKKLAYYLEHDELEKIKTQLTELNSNISLERYDDANINIDTIKFILQHIQDKEKFSLESLF